MFSLPRVLRVSRSCRPAPVLVLLLGEPDGISVAAEENCNANEEGCYSEANDEADDEVGMGGRA